MDTDVEQYIRERAKRKTPAKLKSSGTRKGVTKNSPKLSKWSGKGNPYSRTKSGYRPDLGAEHMIRSGWEANIMRVLKAYKIDFQYEPEIFTFPVKRGNKSYTPDLYLPKSDEWVEIKGYLDKNSKVKLKRFKRHHPKEFKKLTMVISKYSKANRTFCADLGVPRVLFYEDFLRAFSAQIDTWEGKRANG